MSRTNPSYGSNRTPNGTPSQSTGEYLTAPNDASEYSDSVASQVMASDAYRQARQLFLNENDKTWLQRLEAIPYSVKDAKETWFDQIGVVTNFHDKQSANYQYCIEQINALVAEYQQWKNTLPATQVDQFAQVGVNSAVTGQGLSGSSMSPSVPSSNPSALSSASPFEIGKDIVSIASSVLSAVDGGVLSWVSRFDQVRQFGLGHSQTVRMNDETVRMNDQTVRMNDENISKNARELGMREADLNLRLADKGIRPLDGSHASEHIADSDYFVQKEAEASTASKKAILDGYTTYDPAAPLEGSAIQEIYLDLANTKFEIFKAKLNGELAKLKREKAESDYHSGYYGDNPEDFGRKMAKYDQVIKSVAGTKASLEIGMLKRIKERSDKGSIAATYLLDHILTGVEMSTLMYVDGAEAGQKGVTKLLETIDDMFD